MNLVLTMAGKYSRFKLFGSKVPKYLLPLGSETMLSEVIKQFAQSAPGCNFFLIANRNDQIFFPVVRSIMKKHGIYNNALLYINDTSSQLETALNASDLLLPEQMSYPVAFANIDTILLDRAAFFGTLECCTPEAGLLDTFKGENNQYSYARVIGDSEVVDVVDKNVISSNACSGLYGFGSFTHMAKMAAGLLRENGEASFTDLYKKYIDSGMKVRSNYCRDLNHTIVMGSPEEYVINIHRFK
jgi:bifunctional N-acetylglucosamine-1-phosphate-uridyltransferase/glucosamine-1-phosphate-acetyltransferase GlmU-like protein